MMTCTECYGRGWRITDVGIVVCCLKEFDINNPHHGDCPKKTIEEMVSNLQHVVRTHEPMLETLKWSRERLVKAFAFEPHGELVTKLDAAIATGEGASDG